MWFTVGQNHRRYYNSTAKRHGYKLVWKGQTSDGHDLAEVLVSEPYPKETRFKKAIQRSGWVVDYSWEYAVDACP